MSFNNNRVFMWHGKPCRIGQVGVGEGDVDTGLARIRESK